MQSQQNCRGQRSIKHAEVYADTKYRFWFDDLVQLQSTKSIQVRFLLTVKLSKSTVTWHHSVSCIFCQNPAKLSCLSYKNINWGWQVCMYSTQCLPLASCLRMRVCVLTVRSCVLWPSNAWSVKWRRGLGGYRKMPLSPNSLQVYITLHLYRGQCTVCVGGGGGGQKLWWTIFGGDCKVAIILWFSVTMFLHIPYTESSSRKRKCRGSEFILLEKRKKPVSVNDILPHIHS